MADTPKRHWFQFRLRTLLVGVVLIGAVCYVAQQWRIGAQGVTTRRPTLTTATTH